MFCPISGYMNTIHYIHTYIKTYIHCIQYMHNLLTCVHKSIPTLHTYIHTYMHTYIDTL